ncbi:MAG: hypothetical protein H6744_14130 [Deltaproteobacteria bacterium]|nr:hypothetical protein [Deltaproteobacteria bacterium]MCB9787817.1 hypothetical protein [Deltaproteobacteria bacterium]
MRNDTPARLKRLAIARERVARAQRARAESQLRGAEEAIEVLDAAQLEAEAEMRAASPNLHAPTLSVLEVGREVYGEHRGLATQTRDESQVARDAAVVVHDERLGNVNLREKLYEEHRRRRRAEVEKRFQREIDDLASRRGGG